MQPVDIICETFKTNCGGIAIPRPKQKLKVCICDLAQHVAQHRQITEYYFDRVLVVNGQGRQVT